MSIVYYFLTIENGGRKRKKEINKGRMSEPEPRVARCCGISDGLSGQKADDGCLQACQKCQN